jgi:hypothetical protein
VLRLSLEAPAPLRALSAGAGNSAGASAHLSPPSLCSRASSASDEGIVGIGGRRSVLGPLAWDMTRSRSQAEDPEVTVAIAAAAVLQPCRASNAILALPCFSG